MANGAIVMLINPYRGNANHDATIPTARYCAYDASVAICDRIERSADNGSYVDAMARVIFCSNEAICLVVAIDCVTTLRGTRPDMTSTLLTCGAFTEPRRENAARRR